MLVPSVGQRVELPVILAMTDLNVEHQSRKWAVNFPDVV